MKFLIMNFFFKFFIFIIRRWSRFVPWYYFLPFWHVEFLFFSMNQNIKVMLLYQTCWFQHNFLLRFRFSIFHLNSTCESAFSIWHSLLEFHCRLLVCLYASLVHTLQEIISVVWSIMWLAGLSFVHKCFCSNWKTLLGVIND